VAEEAHDKTTMDLPFTGNHIRIRIGPDGSGRKKRS
jgi:hypothetical protein